MMRFRVGLACVAIRGADTRAVKVYIESKTTWELARIRRCVACVGGNNLAKRVGNEQKPRNSVIEVVQSMEELARFLKTWMPNARITTTDVIPRRSNGFFNSRIRIITLKIRQQSEDHHHARLGQNFVINSRVSASETYRPKDLFYDGGDGVHMNTFGYDALTALTDWLLESDRVGGESFQCNVHNHSLEIEMKF